MSRRRARSPGGSTSRPRRSATAICSLASGKRLVFNTPVLLDDRQIEQYSRQIVLAEVGALGQARLLGARVAIGGSGVGAERVLAYLAAAGVGTIVAPAALHAAVDPDHPDLTLPSPAAAAEAATRSAAGADPSVTAPVDAAVTAGVSDLPLAPARRRFWIAGGRAGEVPPCGACVRAALGEAPAPTLPQLADLRDAVLGTVLATEVVKALLGIGTGLRGRVLSYDPDEAAIATLAVAPRASCAACRPAGAED